jgi:hypothetical protein
LFTYKIRHFFALSPLKLDKPIEIISKNQEVYIYSMENLISYPERVYDVMKKMQTIVSLTLVFFLIFSLTTQVFAEENEENRQEVQLNFEDSQDAPWAKGYIGKMQSKNVIKGYDDGTFRPNAPVKRIEAIVMAVRLMGLEDEAEEKSSETSLHFKDANQIPAWGRGHVVVALEQGLFDSTEDKIQPNKPASRLWVVNLLVRALDLEDEALSQMTEIPDFKDVKEIPAGSVGHVNVAIEHGLITGYGDNTFKPNKSVTRGEMAAFLDRTNDGLLEQSGAITLQGTITTISFGETVTDDVYGVDGTITISTFNGDSYTYNISSDLLVQYHERMITADQLVKDDVVTLVVDNNVVLEANLLSEDEVNQEHAGILEFKVEAEMKNDQKIELKYKNKKGKTEAKIEMESEENETKIKGDEALQEMETLMTSIGLSPEISKEDLLNQVLTALNITQEDLKELEIKVTFANGKKIEIEIELEHEGETEDDKDQEEGYLGIQEFKLDVKLIDSTKVKVSYKNEKGKVKAEFTRENESGKESAQDDEAQLLAEILLDELALTSDMEISEATERILAALSVTEDQIEELKFEAKFTNGQELEVEIENEDDDDQE